MKNALCMKAYNVNRISGWMPKVILFGNNGSLLLSFFVSFIPVNIIFEYFIRLFNFLRTFNERNRSRIYIILKFPVTSSMHVLDGLETRNITNVLVSGHAIVNFGTAPRSILHSGAVLF